jgi:hypothetical protein
MYRWLISSSWRLALFSPSIDVSILFEVCRETREHNATPYSSSTLANCLLPNSFFIYLLFIIYSLQKMKGRMFSLFVLLCCFALSLAGQATINITDSASPTYHAHPPGMYKYLLLFIPHFTAKLNFKTSYASLQLTITTFLLLIYKYNFTSVCDPSKSN